MLAAIMNVMTDLPTREASLAEMPILYLIISLVVVAPLSEELLFRYLPIRITQRFNARKWVLYLVIIVSSIIFGYVHGSWHFIFIQGVGGLILSSAFLRGGYASSVTAHAVHNIICLLLVVFPV